MLVLLIALSVAPELHEHARCLPAAARAGVRFGVLSQLLRRLHKHTVVERLSCQEQRQSTPPEVAPLESTVLDLMMDCDFKTAERKLFGALDSTFVATFMARVGRRHVTVGNWAKGSPRGKLVRDVVYTAKKTALVPSHRAVEYQTLSHPSESTAVIDVVTITPDVPLGDRFHTELRYVLQSLELNEQVRPKTHLHVSWRIRWRGHPPRMLAAMVSNGARKGIQANFDAYRRTLLLTLCSAQ